MRAGVLTFLHNNNYGSMLQAWALQTALKDLGCDAVHLDYQPSNAEKLRNLVSCGNSPALILDGIRKRRAAGAHEVGRKKAESLSRFRTTRLSVSAPCGDPHALREASSGLPALIAGSDQVWSPEWLNGAYFLTFAPEGTRRIAYAASLGMTGVDTKRHAKLMSRWIKDFDRVSIREPEGAALVGRLTGETPEVMPDPVFLLPKEAWQAFATPYSAQTPYLLAYFIGDRPDYWETVKREAAREKLDILVVPVTEAAYAAMPSEHIAQTYEPDGWVGLIANASRVVTDSFHGASFASILGVPFTVLRRYSDDSVLSKNSRIDRLFAMCGFEGCRAVPDAASDARLAVEGEKAKAWLASALRL